MNKRCVVKQTGLKDCASACMLSVIRHYKGDIPISRLIELTNTTKNGTSAFHIIEAFKTLNIQAEGVKLEFDDFISENIIFPCIAHIKLQNRYNHFVVIYKITKEKLIIMDPYYGKVVYTINDFKKIWSNFIILINPINTPIVADIENFKSILSIIKPYNKLIKLLIIISLALSIFSIIFTFYIKIIIDFIIKTDSLNLYSISFIFFIILLVKTYLSYSKNYISIYIHTKFDYLIMNFLFNHIILLPYNYFKSRTIGEVISKLSETEIIKEYIIKCISTVIIDAIIILFTVIILSIFSPILLIIDIMIIIIYLILSTILIKSLNYNLIKLKQQYSNNSSFVVNALSNFELMKSFNEENKISTQYNQNNINLMFIQNNVLNKYNILNMINSFNNELIIFINIFISSGLIINGIMELSNLILYNTIYLYFNESIKSFYNLFIEYGNFKIAKDRLLDIISCEVETLENKNFNKKVTKIEIKKLNYSYDNVKNIIENLTLTINESDKILMYGESGSGKSTIAKLLCKFYNTNKNSIFINEIDINEYTTNDIRKKITYVSSNTTLYNDTILNNITDKEIQIEDIFSIIKLTKVDEIIKNKPFGINTIIEENASNLSGGEIQRILLTKAILKPFDVLILDEATSKIDLELETVILENLFRIFKDKIIILITHRKSNLKLYNKIINFNKLMDNDTYE